MTGPTPRVLVTGGAGFVGANLLRRLPPPVRVLDDLRSGSRAYLPQGVELVVGDIRDAEAVAAALRGVDAVVHLAAAGSVVESVSDPLANFDVNVRGTLTVLEQARRAGVPRVVVASTGGALVGDAGARVSERSLPRPISPYGASKAAVEAYCHAYAGAYGLGTVALRFANLYGPFSAHKRGVVTRFFRALHEGQPLLVYGDGSASRDFCYVDDVCAAIQTAVHAELEPGSVLHLATGVETTIAELAALCAEVAGRPGHPVEYSSRRAGEVQRNAAEFTLAARLLGFRPAVTLREGLTRTWEWYRRHAFSDRSGAAVSAQLVEGRA